MQEILVVEDDQDIADLIDVALKGAGWRCHLAPNAEDALLALKNRDFHACVLDLMLPGMDGLSFLRVIRSMRSLDSMPVIIASARDDEVDIVSGLEFGADDYVVKPFSPKVLVARLKAVRRRIEAKAANLSGSPGLLRHGSISIDAYRHEVLVSGKGVELSATEFGILSLFVSEPGRVFTREQIIDRVKGPDYPVTDRAIDVHILSIRRKLESAGSAIETIRGIGYRLRDE